MDASTEWRAALARLSAESRLCQPTELAGLASRVLADCGATATVYLVDREQVGLRPLAVPGAPEGTPVPIEASMAGRAYTTLDVVVSAQPGGTVWIPLIDGSDRLGVVELRLAPVMSYDDPAVRLGVSEFVGLLGHLVVAKLPYGDGIRRARRSRSMSVAGELLWRLLPPLTFATENLLLAAIIEPCYDVGGDAFDYAVDDNVARLGIFDAVGHDLSATVTTALTVSAIRSARASGQGLGELTVAADEALVDHFERVQFTTAVLADIDLADGGVRYVNAGHPPPVLVRDHRVVGTLSGGRRTPLGVPNRPAEPAEATLQPGDRLLFYTDGITEARDEEGRPFGLDRLLDYTERGDREALPVPETLRRLRNAVLAHQHGRLQDDATLMLVEWAPHVGRTVVV